MRKLDIESLVIEVTRKCNLTCRICMRGDAQNIDIRIQYVRELLENVQSIGSLTFSGGEPTLNILGIERVLEMVEEMDISVGNFYIATNGVIPKHRLPYLVKLVARMSMIANDCYDEDEGTYPVLIDLSNELHHMDSINELDLFDEFDYANRYLSMLKGYQKKYDSGTNKSKSFGVNFYKPYSIINEGRAVNYNTNIKKRENDKVTRLKEVEVCDDYYIVSDMVYLTAKGKIVLNCNWSFQRMDSTLTFCAADELLDKVKEYAIINKLEDEENSN